MNPEYNLFIKWGMYNYWTHKSVTILCKVRITYIIHLLTSEIFSFALGALLTDGMDEEVEKCCCVVGTTGGIIRTSCDRCWLVRLLLGTRPSLKLHNYGSFLTTVVRAAQVSNDQHQSNHHKPCHFVCAVLVSKLSTSISPPQIMSVCQQRHATIIFAPCNSTRKKDNTNASAVSLILSWLDHSVLQKLLQELWKSLSIGMLETACSWW